jgi:hypothetical protein
MDARLFLIGSSIDETLAWRPSIISLLVYAFMNGIKGCKSKIIDASSIKRSA